MPISLSFWIHHQMSRLEQQIHGSICTEGGTQHMYRTPLKERFLRYFDYTELPSSTKASPFFKMCFLYMWGLNTMCSIFPFQNDWLGFSFNIQALFNKIPVPFLQIQGKRHFHGVLKDWAVVPGEFQACANHVQLSTMKLVVIVVNNQPVYSILAFV